MKGKPPPKTDAEAKTKAKVKPKTKPKGRTPAGRGSLYQPGMTTGGTGRLY